MIGALTVVPADSSTLSADSVPLTVDTPARIANGAPPDARTHNLGRARGDHGCASVRVNVSISGNGAPGLFCNCRSVRCATPSNMPAGSAASALFSKRRS